MGNDDKLTGYERREGKNSWHVSRLSTSTEHDDVILLVFSYLAAVKGGKL
jgi:hypothetical protein